MLPTFSPHFTVLLSPDKMISGLLCTVSLTARERSIRAALNCQSLMATNILVITPALSQQVHVLKTNLLLFSDKCGVLRHYGDLWF